MEESQHGYYSIQNEAIAKIPDIIPNPYIVKSIDLPAKDSAHFNNESYKYQFPFIRPCAGILTGANNLKSSFDYSYLIFLHVWKFSLFERELLQKIGNI